VSRLLRLLGPSSTFRSLLKVLVYSLPSIYNIGAILLMIYFVYAVLGVNMFSDTMYDQDTKSFNDDNEGINSDANFREFQTAFLTLFRVSTGENWQILMMDCAKDNAFNSQVVACLYVGERAKQASRENEKTRSEATCIIAALLAVRSACCYRSYS